MEYLNAFAGEEDGFKPTVRDGDVPLFVRLLRCLLFGFKPTVRDGDFPTTPARVTGAFNMF